MFVDRGQMFREFAEIILVITQVGVLAQRVWGGRGLVSNSALPKDVDPHSAQAQT